MTAYGSIESAVEAMRRGAYDYLTKPFQSEELLVRVEKAVEKRRLLGEVSLLAGDFRRRYGLENVVGRSPALREVLDRAVRVAATDATVLLTGESGTGKELVARAIHAGSRRGAHPFVPVNCAAITETLLESELFGHARGAFTGAIRARVGLFEEASGGTLFIDEIGETTPGFQAKLLRALQDGEIRRVGESSPVKVDVRIIAATNQDLRRAIAEKRFREDLFYRLNVVPLRIPALRERREDIPLLARHFLEQHNRRSGAPEALDGGRARPDARARLAGKRPRAGERGGAGRRPLRRAGDPAVRRGLRPGRRAPCRRRRRRSPTWWPGAERRAIEAALVRCGGRPGAGGPRARHLRHHAVAQDEAAGRERERRAPRGGARAYMPEDGGARPRRQRLGREAHHHHHQRRHRDGDHHRGRAADGSSTSAGRMYIATTTRR